MEKPNFITKKEYDQVIIASLVYRINPFLILAIGMHETAWGSKGWGRYGYTLGVGCYDEKHSDEHFKGLDAQLNWAGHAIAGFLDFNFSLQSLSNFAKYVWKPGDPQAWAVGVWRWYTQLVSSYASELPICAAPPAWVVPALVGLYKLGILSTPFGDLDFYRSVQIAYNMHISKNSDERR